MSGLAVERAKAGVDVKETFACHSLVMLTNSIVMAKAHAMDLVSHLVCLLESVLPISQEKYVQVDCVCLVQI